MSWFNWLVPIYGVHKWFWDRTRPRRPEIPGRPPQVAAYGHALSLVYGKTRVTGTIVYWEEPGNGTVLYQVALCEGPIAGVARVWQDKNVRTLAEWGLVVDVGSRPTQTAWASLPAGKDIGYPGIAIVHPPLPAGTYPTGIGQFSWEVQGLLHATGDATNGDAHPADILKGSVATPASSMLCNPNYGAGFPFTVEVEVGRDGNAASSYRRYVTAEGLWLSPAFTEQKPASQHLQEVLDASNASCLWTNGLLEIVPLGDQSVTGNSVTYTPAVTVQYALTRTDLIPYSDGSRVRLMLPAETDAFNIAPVEFLDRAPAAATADPAHAYNVALEEDPDPVDVFSTRGEQRAPLVQLHAICQRSIALKIARIRAQQLVRNRAEYEFKIGWRFARLEPFDFVSVKDEDLLGSAPVVVRIRKISEDAETGVLTIRAREWQIGSGAAAEHATSSSDAPSPGITTYDFERRVIDLALSNWFVHDLAVDGVKPQGMTYGEDTLITVGINMCQTSGAAGQSWASQTIPAGGYHAVHHDGSSLIVAVGTNVCATSTNKGVTWMSRTIPTGDYYAVKWVAWLSLWVAVGDSVCATSPDGVTWTSRTIPTGSYRGVTDDSRSIVVAVGLSSVAASSTNGTTWTSRTIPSGSYKAAAFNGTKICATGSAGVCATTDDGITWTSRTTGASNLDVLLAAGPVFVAAGSAASTVSLSLDDGVTWKKKVIGGIGYLFALSGAWTGKIAVFAEDTAGDPARCWTSLSI